jgi:hypothetical protein
LAASSEAALTAAHSAAQLACSTQLLFQAELRFNHPCPRFARVCQAALLPTWTSPHLTCCCCPLPPTTTTAAYAGYTILAGNFPGSQAQYDVLLSRQLEGVSAKDRAAAAAVAVPIAQQILRDKRVCCMLRACAAPAALCCCQPAVPVSP